MFTRRGKMSVARERSRRSGKKKKRAGLRVGESTAVLGGKRGKPLPAPRKLITGTQIYELWYSGVYTQVFLEIYLIITPAARCDVAQLRELNNTRKANTQLKYRLVQSEVGCKWGMPDGLTVMDPTTRTFVYIKNIHTAVLFAARANPVFRLPAKKQ